MINYTRIFALLVPMGTAFQTSQMLPMRIDPIPKDEISHRLGLKQIKDSRTANSGSGVLSIGSGPNMGYTLQNEHEVVCPVSGAHQGVLCTALLSAPLKGSDAESIANNHELVSQAILSGSLAASIRSRCKDGNSVYYLPIVVTLVESLMADEMTNFDFYARGDNKQTVFNSGGLETNEILMDWTDSDFVFLEEDEQRRGNNNGVMLYACNTHSDHNSATSDIYLLPQSYSNSSSSGSNTKGEENKIWRFSVDYKVATINLQSIKSFGNRDSTTPLRPDVWFKDDYY